MSKKKMIIGGLLITTTVILGIGKVAASDVSAFYVDDLNQVPVIDFSQATEPISVEIPAPVNDEEDRTYIRNFPNYELPSWALEGGATDFPSPPLPPDEPFGYLHEWNSIGVYDSAGPIIDRYFIYNPIYDLSGLSPAALNRIDAIREEYRALEDREYEIRNQAPFYVLNHDELAEMDRILDRKTALAIELESLYLSAP